MTIRLLLAALLPFRSSVVLRLSRYKKYHVKPIRIIYNYLAY